ncbi:unnamed protein product, partial [marine sediment metagenome]
MNRELRELVEALVLLFEKGIMSREEVEAKLTKMLQYAGYGDDVIETYLVFFLG